MATNPESYFPKLEKKKRYSYNEIDRLMNITDQNLKADKRSTDFNDPKYWESYHQRMLLSRLNLLRSSCIQGTTFSDVDYKTESYFYTESGLWNDLKFDYTRKPDQEKFMKDIERKYSPKPEPVSKRGFTGEIAEYEAIIDDKLPGLLDRLLPCTIPEGEIAYMKAIKIAFDTETPDKIAKQFSEVLTNAKYYADQAGQPVTIFAQFKVKPNGELAFDCPIEYNLKAKGYELNAILRDKFNIYSYNGKRTHSLTISVARELLKQVRAGNFEGCKIKSH